MLMQCHNQYRLKNRKKKVQVGMETSTHLCKVEKRQVCCIS